MSDQNELSPFRTRLIDKMAESIQGPLPTYTPRIVHGATSLPGKATAVIGMRRAGKTTFLHQLRAERLESGVARECLPYISFEDEQLAGMQAQDLNLLLEEYYRRYPELRVRETVTWCFDEIQVVPGWEKFVRRVLDSEKAEIFISGSSAELLSRELATSMRGRGWKVVMHPFSFEEYLRHHDHSIPKDVTFLSAPERSGLEKAFMDYLTVGGFPEIQSWDTTTRYRILQDYVDVAMFRDVVERHNVTNVTGLHWLVRHLLGHAAGMFSVEKIYATFKSHGLSISKDTVHQFVSYLEDCFLIRIIQIESESVRKRMVNPRKVYPVDPGLIPVYDRTGRANLGHALETIILIELERRGASISYVRTPGGYEVDFLARSVDGKTDLIQVCADPSDPATLNRELRALKEAKTMYPDARTRLLVATRDVVPGEIPKGIIVQPAYEWLLG